MRPEAPGQPGSARIAGQRKEGSPPMIRAARSPTAARSRRARRPAGSGRSSGRRRIRRARPRREAGSGRGASEGADERDGGETRKARRAAMIAEAKAVPAGGRAEECEVERHEREPDPGLLQRSERDGRARDIPPSGVPQREDGGREREGGEEYRAAVEHRRERVLPEHAWSRRRAGPRPASPRGSHGMTAAASNAIETRVPRAKTWRAGGWPPSDRRPHRGAAPTSSTAAAACLKLGSFIE